MRRELDEALRAAAQAPRPDATVVAERPEARRLGAAHADRPIGGEDLVARADAVRALP